MLLGQLSLIPDHVYIKPYCYLEYVLSISQQLSFWHCFAHPHEQILSPYWAPLHPQCPAICHRHPMTSHGFMKIFHEWGNFWHILNVPRVCRFGCSNPLRMIFFCNVHFGWAFSNIPKSAIWVKHCLLTLFEGSTFTSEFRVNPPILDDSEHV